MRILYGVVGEGMGHATRSRVVLEELVKHHEVHIVASGRAADYLRARFPNVRAIWGYTLAYQDNSLRPFLTLLQNLKGAVRGWPKNVRQYAEIVRSFKPDVVVSDFETFSYLFAKNHFLPVISIDNMQIINRCKLDPAVLAGEEGAFQLARSTVKAKLPGAFHYLISTFFYPPVIRKRTTLVPPILRPEILAARPETGEHFLVYQTTTTNELLAEVLKQLAVPCRIYGKKRDIAEDLEDANLRYRPFNEETFIDDLRTARAVIAGGGFTLMSEAIYLHKPVFSVPVKGQFEQILNARYLERLGYGMYAEDLELGKLREFLRRIPDCVDALKGFQQEGNTRMISAINEQLALATKMRA
jgi:uncharacterized protein (TIGR00661 family)